VYAGKKKMVLDHLVVQNLGKEQEEDDVTSMLLAGAKALYETNADGTSATDITYTSKQVEEMIDKVELQAEEEAVVLREKWEKEDAMTEDEKLAALTTKGSETMSFAFAKIWQMGKGDLEEVENDAALEERFDDEVDDDWMAAFENAEKERERKRLEEADRLWIRWYAKEETWEIQSQQDGGY
jgi:chromodomain-helicase-DNA-binding protein 4